MRIAYPPVRTLLAGTAALFLIAAPSGQTPDLGNIVGRITLTTRVRGTPLASGAYVARSVGHHQTGATPEIRNVVVYLRNLTYHGALPAARHAVEQRNEAFVPRVLAITKGSTVDFVNADPFFHNVFSLSVAATFNLGRYQQGRSKARVFARTGLVKVYCDIHSHMSTSILVFDHPYFAVPDLDGTFKLPDIPPGEYTIVGWHERVGERAGTVQVQAGRAASIDFTLPVQDDP